MPINFNTPPRGTIKHSPRQNVTEIEPEPKEAPPEPEKGTGMVNFCRTGDGMARCGLAKKKWKRQIDCKFGVKSRNSERCMNEVFEEYCWCIKAQQSADNLKGTPIIMA